MRRWTPAWVHLVSMAILASAVAAPAAAETVAFLHVDVIPMDSERVLRDQTVVVDDGRIAALGAADHVKVPPGAKIVDVRGHYLLPGLIETHVHPEDDGDMSRYVVHGITTIADLNGGDDARTAAEYLATYFVPRASRLFAVVAELTRWLQIFLWVSLVGWAGTKLVRFLRRSFLVRRPRELVVARWLTSAVALLTAVFTVLFAVATPDYPAGDAVGSTAVMIGMILVAVADGLAAAFLAFMAGRKWNEPAGIGHRIHIVAVAAAAIVLVLTTLYRIPLSWRSSAGGVERLARTARANGDRLVPGLAAYRDRARPQDVAFVTNLVAVFQREGVPVVAGTDPASPAFVAGETMQEELGLLVESGLRSYDALRAATVAPAEMFGLSGEVGTIEVGKRADLMVLAEDPLDDIAVAFKPLGVFSDGRWLGPETLQRLK